MSRRKNPLDDVDVDKYRKNAEHAAAVAKEAAEQAAGHAKEAAIRAQAWAGPQYGKAKAWAKPRAKKAYHLGARKAEPYVRKAGDAATRWADVAHAAIVTAAIPAAVNAVGHAAEDPDDRGRSWGKTLIPLALVGAATAAVVVWARRDPGRDAWAGEDDEWELAGDDDFKQQLREKVNKATDAAVDAAKRASEAAASAAATVKEQAGPTVEKVKEQGKKLADQASSQIDGVRASVDGVRDRATTAAEDALDDAAAVWDDDDTGATPIAKPSNNEPSNNKSADSKPDTVKSGATKKTNPTPSPKKPAGAKNVPATKAEPKKPGDATA